MATGADPVVAGRQDQTYVLLLNPGATPAQVQISYLRTTGVPVVKTYVVPPTSRMTIPVQDVVPEFANETFGADIRVLNGVPIVVERAMYWNALGTIWSGGSGVTGVPIP